MYKFYYTRKYILNIDFNILLTLRKNTTFISHFEVCPKVVFFYYISRSIISIPFLTIYSSLSLSSLRYKYPIKASNPVAYL